MMTFVIYLIISFLSFFPSISAQESSPAPYNPTDVILIDCGAKSKTTSLDGRNWDADSDHSKFSGPNNENASFASKASRQDPSVTPIPFMTARIFRSEFTYIFPVSPGPKFLRLYFHSAEYSGLNITTSFFSATANGYTLLSNFSAYLTASATIPLAPFFIKEYIINVGDYQKLNLTFIPSPNSYSFVNGIEIVSMPSDLYIRGGGDNYQLKPVDAGASFDLESTTNFETLYRLNVGGHEISGRGDSGMYRTWFQDEDYIYGAAIGTVQEQSLRNDPIKYTKETPAYTAPVNVYASERTMSNDPHINLNYNLTWIFPVDARFYYFVRLHFCEVPDIKEEDQRVFSIFINNQTAEEELDVFERTDGSRIPMYQDYVVFATKKELWLTLRPDRRLNPTYVDVILNGIEIFKLNNSQGSLAGPNPDPLAISPEQNPRLQNRSRSNKLSRIFLMIGAVLGATTLLSLLLGCFIFHRKSRRKDSISFPSQLIYSEDTSSLLPLDLCRRFSIIQIRAATHDFDENFLIGKGGFGNVYKGFIDGGATVVAIKRLNTSSTQGVQEFQTEIAMLSQVKHLHLVSLIGYCNDEGEMILVYEYMPHGTLRDHLYDTDNPPLSWKLRLEICLGAARGLQYLHRDAKQSIIHRDVKSCNILLDKNYIAKVSDFGLSKLGPTSMSQTHVSTVVKGSLGYLDPEYYLRQRLTDKSDVYSFGVVLFETLCARRPVIQILPKEQVSLPYWGRICCQRGTLDQIIDPYLTGEIAPECLKKFGEIAESCVSDEAIERPTMNDVVGSLEFALQLQEAAEKKNYGMYKVRKQEVINDQIVSTDDEIFSGSSAQGSKSRSTLSSNGYSINFSR